MSISTSCFAAGANSKEPAKLLLAAEFIPAFHSFLAEEGGGDGGAGGVEDESGVGGAEDEGEGALGGSAAEDEG